MDGEEEDLGEKKMGREFQEREKQGWVTPGKYGQNPRVEKDEAEGQASF